MTVAQAGRQAGRQAGSPLVYPRPRGDRVLVGGGSEDGLVECVVDLP